MFTSPTHAVVDGHSILVTPTVVTGAQNVFPLLVRFARLLTPNKTNVNELLRATQQNSIDQYTDNEIYQFTQCHYYYTKLLLSNSQVFTVREREKVRITFSTLMLVLLC